MSKQLKKSESKKSETSHASALDLDSDSQPISLAFIAQPISLNLSIAQQLMKIQESLDKLISKVSGIHTQFNNKTADVEQIKHRNSELTDTINKVRGFNRELLIVTSDFKKDVYDYLGFPSSPLSPALSHLSSFGNPMCNSFRMVLEKIHCRITIFKWQIYGDRGGSMSIYSYVQNSPAVFDIYLANVKAKDPSFLFNPLSDNDNFFGQLIANWL